MTYSINQNFFGYDKNNRKNQYYHGRDDALHHHQNNEKLGPSWYYYNKKINYDRNSFGHRTKEISDLNLDNYFICIGCSVTEGIGLEEDKRYSNLLEKDLNIHAYNMGVGGTGNDVIFYNLVTWLHTFTQRPKFVVIQWTDIHRFLIEKSKDLFSVNGTWNVDEQTNNFLVAGSELKYFQTRWSFQRKMLMSMLIDIPIIEIPWVHYMNEIYDNNNVIDYSFIKQDYARDLMHPGINTNRIWADLIIEKLDKISR